MLDIKEWLKTKDFEEAQFEFVVDKDMKTTRHSAVRIIDDFIFHSIFIQPYKTSYYFHKKTGFTIKTVVGIVKFSADLIHVGIMAHAEVIENTNISKAIIPKRKFQINSVDDIMISCSDSCTTQLIQRLNSYGEQEETV